MADNPDSLAMGQLDFGGKYKSDQCLNGTEKLAADGTQKPSNITVQVHCKLSWINGRSKIKPISLVPCAARVT